MLDHKDDNVPELIKKVNDAIELMGKDFETFKDENDKRLKEVSKKGSADVITEDKLTKIGESIDTLVESKTALERRIDAEKKEREAFELRMQAKGTGGDDKSDAAVELKQFNLMFPADQQMTVEYYAAYKAAFGKLLRKDNRLLTTEEIKTLSVGSDPDGGYLVTPDVSGRIVTKVYETSEVRQLASIQAITTDALEGIEDLGEAGAGYAGEHAQGSDTTTPQIGKWRIPVHIIDTEPKATQSILDDAAVNVEAWLAGKVADKFARFENAEFCVGTTKIRGFTSYTNTADTGAGVTWGTIGYIATGTSADFGSTVATQADRLFELVGLLKNAYLPNAVFATRRSIINKIRKFKIGAAVDAYVWQPGLQLGMPERILGYPVSRMEDMPTLAADSYSMAFGDFRAGYQIVDRMGIRVLRDPYTAKPYVKFYTTKRTGGGMLNFEAIKLMKFGTT
jgi:HK97 family phage major capsid protein